MVLTINIRHLLTLTLRYLDPVKSQIAVFCLSPPHKCLAALGDIRINCWTCGVRQAPCLDKSISFIVLSKPAMLLHCSKRHLVHCQRAQGQVLHTAGFSNPHPPIRSHHRIILSFRQRLTVALNCRRPQFALKNDTIKAETEL